MSSLSWHTAPKKIEIQPSKIAVWHTSLVDAHSHLSNPYALLSPAERKRSNLFCSAQKRMTFILGRAMLKSILGLCLDRPPSSLEIDYGADGKPELSGDDTSNLYFNLSHSEQQLILVVSCSGPVGVDLEFTHRPINHEGIAKRFFTPTEARQLNRLADGKQEAFFRLWVSKEAYLKAKGTGLHKSLNQFSIDSFLSESPEVVVAEDPEETARWSFHTFTPETNYIASIAYRKTKQIHLKQGTKGK